MTDNKSEKTKPDLGLLEEDDEFEEFAAVVARSDLLQTDGVLSFSGTQRKYPISLKKVASCNRKMFYLGWTSIEEDETDVNVWEDNWDDDNVEDDFNLQLRQELEKQGIKTEQ